MTVYIDLLFALNMLINYLLLRGSAALGGARSAVVRQALAAALGGIYAVASVLPGCYGLQHWIFQIICAACMLLIAFGWKKHTIKQALFFFALSFAFSGAVLLLIQLVEPDCLILGGRAYYAVSMPAMLLLAGACYLVAAVVLKGCGTHTGGDLVDMTLETEGRTLPVHALRDTGNTLRDPITGQNVLILDGRLLGSLFPVANEVDLADPSETMRQISIWYPKIRFRLLSYRAVGVQNGLLLAARCHATVGKKRKQLLVAFSPAPLGDTFDALWGGQQL